MLNGNVQDNTSHSADPISEITTQTSQVNIRNSVEDVKQQKPMLLKSAEESPGPRWLTAFLDETEKEDATNKDVSSSCAKPKI
ncbi:MAG: hypothetical protein ABSA84_08250 [Gammaproteobacteria bacterium]|jgi:hypothetical protein